ncbi:MAG: ABC transporter permease, partial [Microbacterium sp.]|nr:ABC transporter permease [Microbacterium sp.]
MTADAAPSTPVPGRISPRKRPLADRIPVVSHLRNSIGLQRAMLIVGLALTGLFVLTAVFAPLLAPYSWAQQSVNGHDFGTQQPPNATNLLGTTVSGFDVLSRVIWGAQTALLVIVCAIVFS